MNVAMDAPASVMQRLEEIDRDLASRQNALEQAARDWFSAKRDREKSRATAFLRAAGTVAERQATADEQTVMEGKEEEAEWEAMRAVVRVLETRASICQSILRAQSRHA